MEAKRVCVPSINSPNKQRTANASFFFFLSQPSSCHYVLWEGQVSNGRLDYFRADSGKWIVFSTAHTQ